MLLWLAASWTKPVLVIATGHWAVQTRSPSCGKIHPQAAKKETADSGTLDEAVAGGRDTRPHGGLPVVDGTVAPGCPARLGSTASQPEAPATATDPGALALIAPVTATGCQ